jgi:hypothetical protein
MRAWPLLLLTACTADSGEPDRSFISYDIASQVEFDRLLIIADDRDGRVVVHPTFPPHVTEHHFTHRQPAVMTYDWLLVVAFKLDEQVGAGLASLQYDSTGDPELPTQTATGELGLDRNLRVEIFGPSDFPCARLFEGDVVWETRRKGDADCDGVPD